MGLNVLGGRSYALARVLNSLWVEGTLDCNGRGNGTSSNVWPWPSYYTRLAS